MKTKSFTLFIMMALVMQLHSQSSPYKFELLNEPYENLEGSTSLNQGLTWDDPTFAVPIGFEFSISDTTIQNIFINGETGLGAFMTTDTIETGIMQIIIPHGGDLIDRGYDTLNDTIRANSLSNISYLTEGADGNRILKIEWRNAGFYSELFDDDVSTDFVNVQLWLYESDNSIEFRFGPNSVTQPDLSFDELPGPYFGIFLDYNIDLDTLLTPGISLTGPADQPTVIQVTDSLFTVTGATSEGIIYRFEPDMMTSTSSLTPKESILVYPNPGNELQVTVLNPKTEIIEVSIFNHAGQLVGYYEKAGLLNQASDLPSGTYHIQIKTGESEITRTWIKQ